MVNVVKGFIVAKPELADNDFELMWAIWAWQGRKTKTCRKSQRLICFQAHAIIKRRTLILTF